MKTSDDDPTLIRQKILRHAYKAVEEGNLINAAYSQTQPVNVLGNSYLISNTSEWLLLAEHKTLEDEDAEFNQPMWKRMKYQDDKKKGRIVVDEDKLVWFLVQFSAKRITRNKIIFISCKVEKNNWEEIDEQLIYQLLDQLETSLI